jgi:ABC-type multidrug transport system fused ATPase/permease subunit
VPLLLLAVSPLLKPLQRRNLAQREMMGDLSNLATDIVSGLRVLRGIGGEQVFHDRYVRESQKVRRAGVEVGRLQSILDAAQVALPGVFVVAVVWLGATFAVQGRISVGELVAFYGYAAFLMLPLRTATEAINKWIRAFVSARRICTVLSLQPDVDEPARPVTEVPEDAALVDVASGVHIPPGRLTALVSDRPEEAATLADRLGGYAPGDVRWGGVPLECFPRALLRSRLVVSDTGSALFSGRLLDQLDVRGRGLAAGGQRQRLVLARALAADPDVLVLVEPTSAVDAHTEARIADRLRHQRRGRTTVVTTTSPLMLDRADEVVFLSGGRVTAVGPHRELLRDHPAYRALVLREEEVRT